MDYEINFSYAEYEENKVGLYGCRTGHIEYENSIMIFDFDDGVHLVSKDEPELSGMAKMQCHITDGYSDGIKAYVFRKERSGKVYREDWSDSFIYAVNNGEFEFEFVNVYKGYHSILFKGYVWYEGDNGHDECEIELCTDDIVFFWNE